MAERKLSPSRTYVAMCNKVDFSGFYFKKFTIPEKTCNCKDARTPGHFEPEPGWWFLNRVDFVACLAEWIAIEDFEGFDLKA